MKFTSAVTSIVILFVSAFSALWALPISLQPRDVFVPPVTYPNNKTVWIVGQHHNVTWDTSEAPVNITNKIGMIFLRKGGLTTNLSLASNFSILLGRIAVEVPLVETGSDYQVVLFGDSGNFSPFFTITNA